MVGRLLATLVTSAVAGALVLPAVTAGPAAAGSLGDWQRGQWWVGATQLKSWHQQGITGKGVTIALLDGPVATGIPELQGQDVRPTASLCDRDLWRSWGPTTPDGPLDETSFHTTSMAALLVGSGRGNGPGGVGVLGVAPEATLKTYAMFNTVDPAAHQNLDCWGPGLAAFIDRIVADGAQVIQIPVSLDVTGDEIQAAFNRAFAKGIVVVAASGNGGPSAKVMSPGGNAGVLVVGGMDSDGKVLATNPTSTLDSWEQARSFDVEYNIHLVAPGADLVGGGLTAGNRWDSAVLQSGSSGASHRRRAAGPDEAEMAHRHGEPADLLAAAQCATPGRGGRVGAPTGLRDDVVRDDDDDRPDDLPGRDADLRLDGQRHERPADLAEHPAGGRQRRVPSRRTHDEPFGGEPVARERRRAAGSAGDGPRGEHQRHGVAGVAGMRPARGWAPRRGRMGADPEPRAAQRPLSSRRTRRT